ncbi:helix-turn-helix domain-containing protein [uncultured Croceitalea sp.]|uniref:helix-turn-helix domain-containing protein n=1 Tax=uncultured Croceitalea sp. TaxID=1798908 RepID=UPI003306906B
MELLVDFILVGGILMTLVINILLIKKKNKELPHILLAIFFLLLLFVSLRFYAEHHKIRWLYHITFVPEDTIVWFIGPLLMLYIKSLFLESKQLINRNIFHFVPFLLYLFFISIPVLASLIKGNYVFGYLKLLSNHSYLIVIVRGILLICYLVYCQYLFKTYLELVKTNYSSLTNHDFLWIKRLLVGSLLVISIDILSEFYELTFGYQSWNVGYITVIAMITLIAYLGYHGVNQAKILLPNFLLNDDEVQSADSNKPKSGSNISFSDSELHHFEEKLNTILKDKKPYLEEDLTLNKLANMIGTTDKKLSTFLNQHLKTTFYDLINKKRVEAVKEKLQSNGFDNYTLLGIAYESGFRSKTSFNRIFKKETGVSPSQYRKRFK